MLREIRKRAPYEQFLYLADHAHCPYGNHTLTEVRTFATQVTRWLDAQGVKLITIACNTASAAALHQLREAFPYTPFVGMEPAVKPAARITRTGTVGILATETTFQGEMFAKLVNRFAHDITVLTQVCPGLVELVEKDKHDSPSTRILLQRYTQPLIERGADTLVLGCTHYSFLKTQLQDIVGPSVTIIDSAPAVADQVTRLLEEKGLVRSEADEDVGPILAYTTDRTQAIQLSKQAKSLLGESIQIRVVELN